MNLGTTKYILSVTFIMVIAALILASFLNMNSLVYIMMGFFLVFITVFFVFWRCPDCKKHLGKLTVRKCKHCGKEFEL